MRRLRFIFSLAVHLNALLRTLLRANTTIKTQRIVRTT